MATPTRGEALGTTNATPRDHPRSHNDEPSSRQRTPYTFTNVNASTFTNVNASAFTLKRSNMTSGAPGAQDFDSPGNLPPQEENAFENAFGSL
jgi:hypothetical protein